MFKQNWEFSRQSDFTFTAVKISALFQQAFPDFKLCSYEVLSGGCANLNICVVSGTETYLLRIYLRDSTAAQREMNIAHLLQGFLPMPKFYYVGQFGEYTFAVIEHMHGISLRDLLLSGTCGPDFEIMWKVGKMLKSLQQFTFEKAGFFDDTLQVKEPFKSNDLKDFVLKTLRNTHVQRVLHKELLLKIESRFEKTNLSLLDACQPTLVHGDFDPANILVVKENNSWKISALLDFEFAFSGSYLQDIANMLRYAHKMPQAFKDCFLQGFDSALPKNYEEICKLLNISALLDILSRSDPSKRPIITADINELIDYFVDTKEFV